MRTIVTGQGQTYLLDVVDRDGGVKSLVFVVDEVEDYWTRNPETGELGKLFQAQVAMFENPGNRDGSRRVQRGEGKASDMDELIEDIVCRAWDW